MKISHINLMELVGKNTVTRDDGKIVYDRIQTLWNKTDQISVNFDNVLIASVSFMDEAFGHLALNHSPAEIKGKLKFSNISDFDRALLNDIFFSRFRQRNLSRPAAKKSAIKKRA